MADVNALAARAMRLLDIPRPTVADALAGLSVALILIPQSMAYAAIAGMPPYVGLFAAAFPLLIFALFASSPYLQTGPVALTSLLTFGALSSAGFVEESDEWVAAGAVLAIGVGVFRLILGAFRLGSVAYLVSEPVMIGFMSAAAIVIAASQLPKVFGVDPPDSNTLEEAWWALTSVSEWRLPALALSVVTLVLMLGGRRIHRLFPGVLVAVIACLLWSIATDYDGLIVGTIPEGIPSLSLDLPWSELPALLLGAFVIALVGFAEPSAIARTFATADRVPWNASRELVSSGLSNMMSGLSGAFPVGGSFSRSSVNRFAGAQTRFRRRLQPGSPDPPGPIVGSIADAGPTRVGHLRRNARVRASGRVRGDARRRTHRAAPPGPPASGRHRPDGGRRVQPHANRAP